MRVVEESILRPGPHRVSEFCGFHPEPSVPAKAIPSRSERNVSPGKPHRFSQVECVCSCCTSNQSSRSEQGCFPLHYDVNFVANVFLYTPHTQRFHSWSRIFASPLYNRRGWLGDKNQLRVRLISLELLQAKFLSLKKHTGKRNLLVHYGYCKLITEYLLVI